jgi:hypothetical protein
MTTNIGPCNCCGEVCGCSGTVTWEYTTQSGPNGPFDFWEVISPCSEYATNPCCEEKIGDTIMPEYNPLYWSPPVPLGSTFTSPCRPAYGFNRCSCTTCILTWDDFLQSWSVTTGCTHPTANTLHSSCECPTPENNGTTHGETVSLACGCP